MGRFDDESQRTGPEFVGEREKRVRHVAHQRDSLLDRIDQDGKRLPFGAPLHVKHAFDGSQIERIGGKTVNRVGRNRDDAAAPDETRSVVDDLTFGSFR